MQLDPNALGEAWLGHAFALGGQRDSARSVLRHLETRSAHEYVQPYAFALVYSGLGESDAAFRSLEQAIQLRSEELALLQIDPGMDPLRSDPRFAGMLRRIGFVP